MDESFMKTMMSPPSLVGIKRALFVQPHPDDNEIGAGGLMAKLVSQGVEVYGLTVTDDRMECPPDAEGLTVRQREAISAMEAIGVKNAGFLGFADKTDATEEELSAAIVPVIRRLQPNAVFSVDPGLPNECHRDHLKVGRAVRCAVMDAICDFYPRLPDGGRHADTWQADILGQYYTADANVYLNVDDYFEAKLRAIQCHVSQCSPELLGVLELQGRWFGAKADCTHAEAFKLLSFFHLHCFNLPVFPA